MLENTVIDFVRGKLTFDEFGLYMDENPHMWADIQELLTEEMKADRNCPIWNTRNYQVLFANNFNVKASALSFGYESDFGRNLVHMLISDLVVYRYPEIKRKYPISVAPADFVDSAGMCYVEGPETDALIRRLVTEIPEELTKKKKIKLLKETLREAFHLVPRKVPRWVQEPEWPMGKNSPMAFVEQNKDGELVQFVFRDVDTGETKIVEQYY
jgi:hypothetical protein